MNILHTIILSASEGSSSWTHWPFGPGYTGGWFLTITKFIFIALCLALILLVLRIFFGPGGFFRDKEMDEEAKREREKNLKTLDELRQKLVDGEISPEEFERRKRALMR